MSSSLHRTRLDYWGVRECGCVTSWTDEPTSEWRAEMTRSGRRIATTDTPEAFEEMRDKLGDCPHRGRTGPRIALRHDVDGLDDVVVKDVEMFRAEMMSSGDLWLCCYLTNGERITFDAYAAKKNKLEFKVVEEPSDWIDLDENNTDA